MKYAAFLRAVNVGGANIIKMDALRESVLARGFENVRTYVNSGNVVFETAEADPDEVAVKVEKAIESDFSLKIPVMVRTFDEVREIVANNPFEGQFESHKEMHVVFLTGELPPDKIELLLSHNCDSERFAVRGRDVFCLLRIGVADSLLGKKYIDNKLKMPATARNWRTVNKILEF